MRVSRLSPPNDRWLFGPSSERLLIIAGATEPRAGGLFTYTWTHCSSSPIICALRIALLRAAQDAIHEFDAVASGVPAPRQLTRSCRAQRRRRATGRRSKRDQLGSWAESDWLSGG